MYTMVNMLEQMQKKKHRRGTEEQEDYVMQLMSTEETLKATSLIYESII